MLDRKYIKLKRDGNFKEITLDGGNIKINEKEVKEDEYRKQQKFREYDKLRRLAIEQRVTRPQRASAETKGNVSVPRTEVRDERRRYLQSLHDKFPSEDSKQLGKPRKHIDLDS